MHLFWKYFFQGFGHYFNPSNCDRNSVQAVKYVSPGDRPTYDFQVVLSDFTKIYNKITEIKK